MNFDLLLDYGSSIFALLWGLVLAIAGAWATDIGEWYGTPAARMETP